MEQEQTEGTEGRFNAETQRGKAQRTKIQAPDKFQASNFKPLMDSFSCAFCINGLHPSCIRFEAYLAYVQCPRLLHARFYPQCGPTIAWNLPCPRREWRIEVVDRRSP